MRNLKNNKGVTLIVLTITVIVLLIITSITMVNSTKQLGMKNVNSLYSDIESISTKVSDYYLKNNSLPIFQSPIYLNSRGEFGVLVSTNGGRREIINSNDSGKYYVLDLSKLENLTLNYGRQYKEWDTSATFQEYQDLYIINGTTHQIYYPKGVKYNGTTFFTKNSTSNTVNKITNVAIPDTGFRIESINVNKNAIPGSTNIILSADIELYVDNDNFQKETLKYGWKVATDTQNISFTDFSLNALNSAKLISKQLSDVNNYYLYIKILDINGEEHIIEQLVTIE